LIWCGVIKYQIYSLLEQFKWSFISNIYVIDYAEDIYAGNSQTQNSVNFKQIAWNWKKKIRQLRMEHIKSIKNPYIQKENVHQDKSHLRAHVDV
jgi:hypothetical protein